MGVVYHRMNRKRREQLQEAVSHLEQATGIVETVWQEEQDSLDNMPENLQASERYEKMEAAIDCLEDAASYLNDANELIVQACSE